MRAACKLRCELRESCAKAELKQHAALQHRRRPPGKPANHQATTTNSNNTTTGKPKITPNATKGLGKGTDEQTGEGRWCLIISPPVLVLCLAEATGSGGAGWSSWHYQVDHPIARRRARAHHARVTHSTGRARSCRAQRSRRCAGMALGVRDHVVARSRSPLLA